MKLKYFKIFLFFLCISCGYTNKEISQIVKEWQNKEIIFPYSLQSKIMGKDTACNYLLNKKYKILFYVSVFLCVPRYLVLLFNFLIYFYHHVWLRLLELHMKIFPMLPIMKNNLL